VRAISNELVDVFGVGVIGDLSLAGCRLVSKVATGGMSVVKETLTGRPSYYNHLLNARSARSHVNPSDGLIGKTVGLGVSFAGNVPRNIRSFFR